MSCVIPRQYLYSTNVEPMFSKFSIFLVLSLLLVSCFHDIYKQLLKVSIGLGLGLVFVHLGLIFCVFFWFSLDYFVVVLSAPHWPGAPPFLLSIHFLISCSFFAFLICFTYFLLLFIPSLSMRIVSLFPGWRS